MYKGIMNITRTSSISGKTNTLDLNVTEEQILKWQFGTFAQDAFPNLDASEREFIMTGITPNEWENMFG